MTKIKDYDLITVDEHRIQTTIDVYFQWKTLDIMLSTLSTRGINFPSEISENIVCYTCGYFLNKGSSGDAIDPNGNRIIEIKGSSSTGPSSFSPSERFDELVFVKLNKQNDTLLIYLTGINNVSLGSIYVNATETVLEQQLAGRRPRFNIEDKIIKPFNIQPSFLFDLRDPYPIQTFEANFPIKVDQRDICDVKASEVPNIDIILGGFPCQAFSIAGYRKGFEDEKGRGTLFFEILRIIKAKKPKAILLENVKNLVSHDNGNTFRVILEALKDAGYHVRYAVLNAMEYGNIPQNRERIYIVGFKSKKVFEKFTFPEPIPLKKTIHDVIDFINPVDEKYLYTKGKYKGDIYDKLVAAMDDSNAVYQWRRKYVRKNMSGVVPTLTANQGEGGHNVCLVKTRQGIRKMTPKECFNTQGFPESFVLPNIADGRLYKQAGNSVCVSVVKRIAEQILVAMK